MATFVASVVDLLEQLDELLRCRKCPTECTPISLVVKVLRFGECCWLNPLNATRTVSQIQDSSVSVTFEPWHEQFEKLFVSS